MPFMAENHVGNSILLPKSAVQTHPIYRRVWLIGKSLKGSFQGVGNEYLGASFEIGRSFYWSRQLLCGGEGDKKVVLVLLFNLTQLTIGHGLCFNLIELNL